MLTGYAMTPSTVMLCELDFRPSMPFEESRSLGRSETFLKSHALEKMNAIYEINMKQIYEINI